MSGPSETPTTPQKGLLGGALEIEPLIANKYQLERVLGDGAFAVVYQARHKDVPSLIYALKVLRQVSSDDPAMRARFRRETELAASLRSPHVAQVIDYGETQGGLPYLVMPYLEGMSADQLLKRDGRLRPADVAQIGLDVLQGLVEAHRVGIVHRDLKPPNLLLLSTPGRLHPLVKVLDFGIAKIVGRDHDPSHFKTVDNTFLGTPAFSAPEALAGNPGPCSDIYSLGHTLAHLLEGKPPYGGAPTHALAIQLHLSPDPVPFGPHVQESGLADVIAKACEKKVANRFQSAEEMHSALLATGRAAEERPPLLVQAAPDEGGDETYRATPVPPRRGPSAADAEAEDRSQTSTRRLTPPAEMLAEALEPHASKDPIPLTQTLLRPSVVLLTALVIAGITLLLVLRSDADRPPTPSHTTGQEGAPEERADPVATLADSPAGREAAAEVEARQPPRVRTAPDLAEDEAIIGAVRRAAELVARADREGRAVGTASIAPVAPGPDESEPDMAERQAAQDPRGRQVERERERAQRRARRRRARELAAAEAEPAEPPIEPEAEAEAPPPDTDFLFQPPATDLVNPLE